MKTLIKILLGLFICLSVQAQQRVALTFSQDVKLATMEDDHGNKPFTLNGIVRLTFEGRETEYGYGVVLTEYEYANLSADYHRWSYGFGYNFFIKISDSYYLDLLTTAQFGNIAREYSNNMPFTGVGNIDIRIPLFKGSVKILLASQCTLRTDLKPVELKPAFFIGIQTNLYNVKNK